MISFCSDMYIDLDCTLRERASQALARSLKRQVWFELGKARLHMIWGSRWLVSDMLGAIPGAGGLDNY